MKLYRLENMKRLLRSAEQAVGIATHLHETTEGLEWIFEHGRFGYFVGGTEDDSTWYVIHSTRGSIESCMSGKICEGIPMVEVMRLLDTQTRILQGIEPAELSPSRGPYR